MEIPESRTKTLKIVLNLTILRDHCIHFVSFFSTDVH